MSQSGPTNSLVSERARVVGPVRAIWCILALMVGLSACEQPAPPEDEIPAVVLIEPGPEYAEALDSSRTVIRRAIQRMYLPGVSVAVGQNGGIIWSEGFGWDDLSQRTPATPESLYPAGSISKSMTSAGIGVLVERGLVDLDADVQTYLPDFPRKEKGAITTRQLMGHIAGVQNYGIALALRQGHCDDLVDHLAVMADDTLLWEPGYRYRYSNFGFRMVGAVLRVAADEPYRDFMLREVFDPMGMYSTVPDTALQTADDLSIPYNQRSFSTIRQSMPVDMSCTLAEGGYLTTPSDLVRFGFGMLEHRVLEPETVDMLWTSLELNSGAPTGYGLGWSTRPVRLGTDEGSTPAVGHGGSTLGGRASLLVFPESGLVVATMTNVRGQNVNMQRLSGYVASFFRLPEEGS